MGYPSVVDYPLITIPSGQAVSDEIDLKRGTLAGLVVPATLEATTAQVSFLAATSSGGTYKTVKQGGTKIVLPIAALDYGMLPSITDLLGVRFLKIQLETSGDAAVVQTGARVFEAVVATLDD
jgi:hypothetical protein